MTYRVTAQCPSCGHEFCAGWFDDQTWWGHGLKPESLTAIVYCQSCQHPPPMQVSRIETDEPQMELFR